MDLEDRLTKLEMEVRRLQETRNSVVAPFRVQREDGSTLVEIDDSESRHPEIRVFNGNQQLVLKLLSEEGGGAILVYAEDESCPIAVRAGWGSGGEITVYSGDKSRIALVASNEGSKIEISNPANGSNGILLGTDVDGTFPVVLLNNDSWDRIVYIGPGKASGGRVQVMDDDGWGVHEFPKGA